jgi:hypothetical protein
METHRHTFFRDKPMRLPNTFRPKKNLDKKIDNLIKKKKYSFDYSDSEALTLEAIRQNPSLKDDIQSVTITFKSNNYEFKLIFFCEDNMLSILLDATSEQIKKAVSDEEIMGIAKDLEIYYSTEAVRFVKSFESDSFKFRLSTENEFSVEDIINDIELYFMSKYEDVKKTHVQKKTEILVN